MKTQIELEAYYKKEFEKIVASKGGDSEYATFAFYQLQGIKMGMDMKKSASWAQDEMKRLKKITLDNV